MHCRRRLSVAVVAAVTAALSLPSFSSAGSYETAACRASASQTSNVGWSAFDTRPESLSVANGCAPGSAIYAGLTSRDIVLAPTDALAGDQAGWQFTAPSGTTIAAVAYDAYTHIKYDEDWTVGLRVTGGPLAGQYDDCHVPVGVEACTTGIAGGGSPRTRSSLGASKLEFGAWCEPINGNVGCSVGDTNMDAVLYAATVTLNDPTAPTASPPTGAAITSGAWTRGTTSIGVSGSDGQLGVRRLLLARDNGNVLVDTYDLTCTADPVPCPLGTQGHTFSVDTTSLPDGVQSLVGRSTDGADNVTDSTSVTLRVDNTAPGAPAAAGDSSWSQAFDGTVEVPIGTESDRAPIATVEIERCDPGVGAGACTLEGASAGAPGATQSLGVSGLDEGVTTLRARLVDAAGNVGAFSAPVALRRDRTAPTLTIAGSSDPVKEGDPLVPPPTTTTDGGGSGGATISHEVSANGGSFVPLTTQRARVGETYRFRARATDAAGNSSDWVLAQGERPTTPRPPVTTPPPTTSTTPTTTATGPGSTPAPTVPGAARITVLTARRLVDGRARIVLRGTTTGAARTVRVRLLVGRRTIIRTVRVTRSRWSLTLLTRTRGTRAAATVTVPGSSARAARRSIRISRAR